jgi:hypothetical protein
VQEAIDRFFPVPREVALVYLFNWPHFHPATEEAETLGGAPLLSRLQELERRLLAALYLAARQHEDMDAFIDAHGVDYPHELRGNAQATLHDLGNLWRLVPELRE